MVREDDDRRDDMRRRLLDAARAIVADRGLDALTVQGVTSAAGLSLGGFYNHFESKDALIAAMIDTFTAPTDELRREVAAGNVEALDAMRFLLERAIGVMREDPTRAAFMHQLMTGSEFEARMLADTEAFLTLGLPTDDLVSRNLGFFATLVKGAVSAAYEYVASHPDEIHRDTAPDDAYAILLRLLGAQHAVD